MTATARTYTYATLADVKAANKAAGHHWFSAGALAFFNSRIESALIGGKWFVTSEAFDADAERRYTVRRANANGTVGTVGDFQAHATLEAALEDALELERMDRHVKAAEAAHELGTEHAKAAATWTVDGNTKPEHVAAVVKLLDEGADAGDYLPRRPNLSGEYADDLTPARLAAELGIDPDDAELVEAACDAYDEAVAEAFEPACEAELRNAL